MTVGGGGGRVLLVHSEIYYVSVTRYQVQARFSSCDGGSPSLNILNLPGLEHALHLIEN